MNIKISAELQKVLADEKTIKVLSTLTEMLPKS